MLKRLHNNISACKLRQLFTDSPVVLVSQTLGSINQGAVKDALQQGLEKRLPDSSIQVQVCRVNNAVAAGTGNEVLQHFFQTSNLLVGFSLPQYRVSQTQQQPQQEQQQDDPSSSSSSSKVSRGSQMDELVGGILEREMEGPHVPHSTLRSLIEASLELPSQHPLVLLGAFYKRQHVSMSELGEWIKLNEAEVYGGLLQLLDAPISGVLEVESVMEEMLQTVDGCGPQELLACLEHRGSGAGSAATAEAGHSTAG